MACLPAEISTHATPAWQDGRCKEYVTEAPGRVLGPPGRGQHYGGGVSTGGCSDPGGEEWELGDLIRVLGNHKAVGRGPWLWDRLSQARGVEATGQWT